MTACPTPQSASSEPTPAGPARRPSGGSAPLGAQRRTLSTRRAPGGPRRWLIALLAAVAVIASPAGALATTTDPAEAAAGWLAEQLVDGQRLVGSWTDADGNVNEFDDHGGTADVVFALAAAGVGANHIAAAVDWLIDEAAMYTGQAFGAVSAGATAKLALAVMADGRDPSAVGDDLIAALEALEVTDGAHAGRFSDAGDDDWSSTISQALAILALERAEGATASPEAIDYLLAQQCEDGGYPLSFIEGGCTSATDIDGDSAIDATLIVVQALVAVDEDTAEVVAWLEGQLGPDGPSNSNTAGLAAVAFDLTGRSALAERARQVVLGLQDGCDAEATGAIAYDDADGGDRVFATRQAVLGIAADGGYLTVSSAGASEATPALDCGSSPSAPLLIAGAALVVLVAAGGFVVSRRRNRAADGAS